MDPLNISGIKKEPDIHDTLEQFHCMGEEVLEEPAAVFVKTEIKDEDDNVGTELLDMQTETSKSLAGYSMESDMPISVNPHFMFHCDENNQISHSAGPGNETLFPITNCMEPEVKVFVLNKEFKQSFGVVGTGSQGHVLSEVKSGRFDASIFETVLENNHVYDSDASGLHKYNTVREINQYSNSSKKNHALKYEKGFECNICFKYFGNKKYFKAHLSRHTNEQRKHQCKECFKLFTAKNALQRHYVVHTGERNFKCDICSKYFTDKSNIARHMLLHMVKIFHCGECDKSFHCKNYLRSHLLVHSGVRDYHCELCDKCFRTKQDLKYHLNRHLGVKRYNCNECSNSFADRGSFKKHLARHSSSMAHQCIVCFKRFTLTGVLTGHMSLQNNPRKFQCNECFKLFHDRDHISKHDELHTGKIFQCYKCLKCFSRRKYLNIHERRHDGVKKYNCEVCNKYFVEKKSLREHLLSLHSIASKNK